MFSDEYISALKSANGLEVERVKAIVKLPYLKCIKTIDTCQDLEVGDLLLRQSGEIWHGGYEYVVCKRRDDGEIFKFRIDHLEDCFEIEEVEEERLIWMGDDE